MHLSSGTKLSLFSVGMQGFIIEARDETRGCSIVTSCLASARLFLCQMRPYLFWLSHCGKCTYCVSKEGEESYNLHGLTVFVLCRELAVGARYVGLRWGEFERMPALPATLLLRGNGSDLEDLKHDQ